jgi:hypothetical protein
VSLPNLPDVPRERRHTATLVAVGVFGVLCVLALVLGLKGLFAPADGEPASASSTASSRTSQATDPGGSASESAPAATSSTTTTKAADLTGFSSPSGNIRCEISSAGARCDVASRSWRPPAKPASCHSDWGQGLQVSADGAGFVCASDAATGGPALAYGASIVRGDVRCDSDKDGVTCVHGPSGHAFTVARASYDLR